MSEIITSSLNSTAGMDEDFKQSTYTLTDINYDEIDILHLLEDSDPKKKSWLVNLKSAASSVIQLPSRGYQAIYNTFFPVKKQLKNGLKRAQSSTSINGKLLTIHEIPEFMLENHYLIDYYLPPTNSIRSCLRSIFRLHNQTSNTWTHLLPGLIFLASIFESLMFEPDDLYLDALAEKTIINLYKFCCFVCFICSGIYHSHMNHETHHTRCKMIDISGIVVMIGGTTVGFLYYVFYCFKFWQIFYIGLSGSLTMGFIIFNSLGYFTTNRILPTVLLTSIALTGCIPFFHFVSIYGFSDMYWESQFDEVIKGLAAYAMVSFVKFWGKLAKKLSRRKIFIPEP